MHYACRAEEHPAFLEPIRALAVRACARVRLHSDREAGGQVIDLAAIVDAAPPDSYLYCCGPGPMLDASGAATAHLEPHRVRLEHFAPAPAATPDGTYTVVLARSGRELEVEEGVTILETLLQHGISHNYSCTQGICGTCETTVLEGVPDHRDWVLSDDEKSLNTKMMICCSSSRTDRLVLDL